MPVSAVVRELPFPVYASSTSLAARIFSPSGEGWDFAVAGLPFNGAAATDHPLLRQTAPARKDQSDTSREAGEHSLAFWWSRAQSSFHGGAGQRYLSAADSDTDLSTYRYLTSEGVDVFTEAGKVSVLGGTQRILDSTGDVLLAGTDSGQVYAADGVTITRHYMTPVDETKTGPQDPMSYTFSTVEWGGSLPVLSIAASGSTYYVATSDGIYKGSGTGAAVKIYDIAGSVPVLAYVKQRLILALNNAASSNVYELDANAPALAPLPTALFTAGPNWEWTDVAQTPGSILIAGNNGRRSAVYRMTLDASGTVPLLLPGVVNAEFPAGELVTGMATYLGSVIGVQTTAGFRAGVLNSSGDFQYGSLLFAHPYGAASSGVFGADNSLYAGWKDDAGNACLVRVDLTEVLGSNAGLRFPYAPHLRAMDDGVPTGGAVGNAMVWDRGRKVFAVPGFGVYAETHGHSVLGGSLTTSRIRWDTLENKVVRFLRIRGEGASGRIVVEVSRNADDSFAPVGSIDVAKQSDSGDMYVQIPPSQYVVIRFLLTDSAVLTGYQMKALPAQRRQRFLQIPLFCFDKEYSNSGQLYGTNGTAMGRVLALEAVEQTGDVVALQWLSADPSQELTEYVTIEQIEFSQISGPSDRRGWGGILTLTLRTVD